MKRRRRALPKRGDTEGDDITAVDCRETATIPLYEPRRRLRDTAPGTVVVFRVKGKGDLKVTLRDLI